MADNVPVDPHGIRIEIERGEALESAELDAALEQLAQALASLEAPEPVESDDDEVQGFNFTQSKFTPNLKIGDVMSFAPKFEGPGTTAWCISRCGANSDSGCQDYCWIEG